MKPPVDHVRTSKQGRDHLAKLRRYTGIEHWNILSRWAVCVSLKEDSPPSLSSATMDGGVEMTWKVFAGELDAVISALIWHRLARDGFPETTDGAAVALRAHLNRGLAYLASGTETRSISALLRRWLTRQNGTLTPEKPTAHASEVRVDLANSHNPAAT